MLLLLWWTCLVVDLSNVPGALWKDPSNTKKGRPRRDQSLSLPYRKLSAETKLLDDSSVSLDVDSLEVIQKLTSFTHEAKERTTCDNVLLVLLHMLCKVSDTVGE